MKKACLLTATGALAMTLPATAYGQAVSPPPAAEPAAPANSPDSGINEIIVTAQKRSENLQRTPAAVTAVSGATLVQNGISDLRAAQVLVPSARFQAEGSSTQVYLRGVGSALDYANVEAAVGFNFNGVYIPREGTSVPLYDIAQLEVLPGPQGTLYGRSALGGTINIGFKRPTHDLSTEASIEVGNYALLHVTAAQNIPLTSNLALRAAVDYTRHDGIQDSGADSNDTVGGRLSLLYDPAPDIKAYLWGYFVRKGGSQMNPLNKGLDPNTLTYSENAFLRHRPWDDLRPGPLAALAPFGQPSAGFVIYHNYVGGGQVDIGLGRDVTLTYIPGYFSLDSQSTFFIGAIPANASQKSRQITQELRLSGHSGQLNWLAGLYGYRVVNSGGQILFYFLRVSDVVRNRLKGAAAFGQATYSVSDRFRVTAGGRYGVDDRTGEGFSSAGLPYSFSKSYNHFDYKLGVEYDVASRVMVYANYQTGYRPGTYNEKPTTSTFDNTVKPSALSSISAGIKSRFLDNRLQVNNEIFYYNYKDLLVPTFNPTATFNPVLSAKRIHIWGDQLDLIFAATPNDQFRLSIGYLHARNIDFTTPDGGNYNGLQLAFAPDWTVAGGYHHDFQMQAGHLRAQVDARYESQYWGDYAHSLGLRQRALIKPNASITYFSANDRWSLGVWIKNITNKESIAAAGATGIPGPATAYLEAPRTFGLRATGKF